MRLPPVRAPQVRSPRSRSPLVIAAALLVVSAPVLPGAPGGGTPAQASPAAAAVTPAAARAGVRTGAAVGYDQIGLRRGGTWLLRDTIAGGGTTDSYAEAAGGYVPVAGDTDGNGEDSVSLFKSGTWRITDSRRGPARVLKFGTTGDVPVLGDWDSDGVDTPGLYRRGRWYLMDEAGDVRSFLFGNPGDQAIVGDWNGDGATDVGLRRGTRFYERDARTAGGSSRSFVYGKIGDLPFSGDWNHDGKDDVGVFRDGKWSFRDAFGVTQSTTFGTTGDRPVIRRTLTLAPGLTHRVVTRAGSVAQVATLTLASSSTPAPVLAGNRLAGLETTTSMARRSYSKLAVNGDFAQPTGRPVHAFADRAQLQQSSPYVDTALGLLTTGLATASAPDLTISITTDTGAVGSIHTWNVTQPLGDSLGVYTATGAGLETAPAQACYAGLTPLAPPSTGATGTIDHDLRVTGTRCGGPAPALPATDLALVGGVGRGGESFIRSLAKGQLVRVSQTLGYPRATGLLGGSEALVVSGRINTPRVDAPGAYVQGAEPRTAVGTTADGRLLIVEVDGRRSGWSKGMSLRQIAQLMQDLGAVDAINLDGGGSSTMVINGIVLNRPSDNRERAVSSALVVLAGADPGLASLRDGSTLGPFPIPPIPIPTPPPLIPGLPLAAATVRTPQGGTQSVPRDGLAAAQDPGSTGGLADSLAREGVTLTGALGLAEQLFRQAR